MYDICCVGHITSDKIITPHSTVQMPGGTALYFSRALQHFDIHYRLVTSLAKRDMGFVEDLRNEGIDVLAYESAHTVCFENMYTGNQDHRIQKVSKKADPFVIDHLAGTKAAIYHLGPLLRDDIGIDMIKYLSGKGKVSLDVQGYLREVRGAAVYTVDWAQKIEALQYISILKANETEAATLTGNDDIYESAKILAGWGVAEVIITLGSIGSIIYSGNIFYKIPAFEPKTVTDATGCGDTYMAGYLYRRSKGFGEESSGRFAAAMAALKIEKSGPFAGHETDVALLLNNAKNN